MNVPSPLSMLEAILILLDMISSSSVTRIRLWTNSFVMNLSRTKTDLISALPSLSTIQPYTPETNVLTHSSTSSPAAFKIFFPVAFAEEMNPQIPVLISPAILFLLSFELRVPPAFPVYGSQLR